MAMESALQIEVDPYRRPQLMALLAAKHKTMRNNAEARRLIKEAYVLAELYKPPRFANF